MYVSNPLSSISTVSPSKKTGLKSGFKLFWLLLLEKRRRRHGGGGAAAARRKESICVPLAAAQASLAKQAKQAKEGKGRKSPNSGAGQVVWVWDNLWPPESKTTAKRMRSKKLAIFQLSWLLLLLYCSLLHTWFGSLSRTKTSLNSHWTTIRFCAFVHTYYVVHT